mmetsp:Transcript_3595/g.13177  ORF Transcript_3595/g.13177 Transcript_3595/m.13177 type:complete len:205 (-) Transcript_3595:677-1291(-)
MREAIVRVLQQVGAPTHAVDGLVCLHVQQGLDLHSQTPVTVTCELFQVVPLLRSLYDVSLPVLQLVELLVLEYSSILLGLGSCLFLACELHLAQDEASVDDGIARAQHRFLDVARLHVGVPPDHVFLALVVDIDHLLLYVLTIFGFNADFAEHLVIVGRPRRSLTSQTEEIPIATAAAGRLFGLGLLLLCLGGRRRSDLMGHSS